MECLICAESIDNKSRLPCYGTCGHSDICSICFLRIRALGRDFSCPVCKNNLEHVICSAEADKNFGSFQIWGDNIGDGYCLDQKSMMFFPTDYFGRKVESLWNFKCKVCNQKKRDQKSLKAHLAQEHQMQLCSLCSEHRQSFPSEQKAYTASQYDVHLKKGGNDGCEGHPNCEFCKKRFYDKLALFVHLQKDHFTCHICDKRGIKYKYFAGYHSLEKHFRSDHLICEEKVCIDKKFIVFADEFGLMAHNIECHPHLHGSKITAPLHFRPQPSTTLYDAIQDTLPVQASGSNVRYDAGLGGQARNGEWTVLLSDQSVARDPRDPHRNDHIEITSTIATGMATASATDEGVDQYPALPQASTSATSSSTAQRKLKTTKQQQQKLHNNQFPGLPSSSSDGSVVGGRINNNTPSVYGSVSSSGGSSSASDLLGGWSHLVVNKKLSGKHSHRTKLSVSKPSIADAGRPPSNASEVVSNGLSTVPSNPAPMQKQPTLIPYQRSLDAMESHAKFENDMTAALKLSVKSDEGKEDKEAHPGGEKGETAEQRRLQLAKLMNRSTTTSGSTAIATNTKPSTSPIKSKDPNDSASATKCVAVGLPKKAKKEKQKATSNGGSSNAHMGVEALMSSVGGMSTGSSNVTKSTKGLSVVAPPKPAVISKPNVHTHATYTPDASSSYTHVDQYNSSSSAVVKVGVIPHAINDSAPTTASSTGTSSKARLDNMFKSGKEDSYDTMFPAPPPSSSSGIGMVSGAPMAMKHSALTAVTSVRTQQEVLDQVSAHTSPPAAPIPDSFTFAADNFPGLGGSTGPTTGPPGLVKTTASHVSSGVTDVNRILAGDTKPNTKKVVVFTSKQKAPSGSKWGASSNVAGAKTANAKKANSNVDLMNLAFKMK